MNAKQDRFSRARSLLNIAGTQQSVVGFIGCGRFNGPTATQLVRHGAGTGPDGQIVLIDPDVVEPHNLIGTDLRASHIGMSKAEAHAQLFAEIDPAVNVSYRPLRLTEADIPDVVALAERCQLLVLGADDVELMLRISDAVHNLCPLVMGVFGPGASFAEVAYSLPHQTAPLRRTFGQRQRSAINGAAALGCDTLFVCSFVTSLCLRLLAGNGLGSNLVPCYRDAPLYIVGVRERGWVFSSMPIDLVRTIVLVGDPASVPPHPVSRS